MFSAPLLLRLAYCAARDRFGPDITTVGSAVLSGLIAAWIGLNYPVQTNGFFAFLQGAVLFCALVGVLGAVLVTVVGSPLSFFGRLKKAGEILFYRVSVGLTLALSLAGLVATLVELLGYRVF
jgi:hypothetical protein